MSLISFNVCYCLVKTLLTPPEISFNFIWSKAQPCQANRLDPAQPHWCLLTHSGEVRMLKIWKDNTDNHHNQLKDLLHSSSSSLKISRKFLEDVESEYTTQGDSTGASKWVQSQQPTTLARSQRLWLKSWNKSEYTILTRGTVLTMLKSKLCYIL